MVVAVVVEWAKRIYSLCISGIENIHSLNGKYNVVYLIYFIECIKGRFGSQLLCECQVEWKGDEKYWEFDEVECACEFIRIYVYCVVYKIKCVKYINTV